MRLMVLVAMVVACVRGNTKRDTRKVGRDALVAAAGDAKALGKLLQGSVVNGGLWFDDATCTATFGTPGEIRSPQLQELARCLVTLRLQASKREDALGDVVVLHYAPGFELEARVIEETSGPRLVWIGYSARREADIHPTITSDAVEALRLTGDRHGPLDPAVAATLAADAPLKGNYTWIKFCLDETGKVTTASSFQTTSVKASDAFSAAAKAWTFKPFTIQGQPMPVCSLAQMAYPPGSGPNVETLPMPPPPPSKGKREPIVFAEGARKLTEGKRISGTRMIVPDDRTKTAIKDAGLGRITGSFRICLDEDGRVKSVLPMRSTGFADYDRRLMATMQTWVYSPYMINDQRVPVCTAVTFTYSQN